MTQETDTDRHQRTGLSSLDMTEQASAAAAQTPNRVPLASIPPKIKHEQFINPIAVPHMTIYVAVLENGFAVVGKSAPADPANFNEELGKKFAREDAVRQIWQLEGYALREKMHGQEA